MKNKQENDLKKKQPRGLLPGGVPFTGAGNWLDSKKKKGENISEKIVVTENIDLDMFIFRKVIKILKPLYPSVLIMEKSSMVMDSDQHKILKKIKILNDKLNLFRKPAVFFMVLRLGDGYAVCFVRNKGISDETFLGILKHFQVAYNLLVVGYDTRRITGVLLKKEFIYTPTKSYPEHQICIYTTIAEKIRSESEVLFYDSLLPALDFMCLSSYVVTKEAFRLDHASFARPVLGNDSLKSSGIKYANRNFGNFSEAKRYYEKNTSSGKSLILRGYPKYFHFMVEHRDAYESGVKLGNDTLANFSGIIDENPIIHATKRYYFGRLGYENFQKFWRGAGKEGQKGSPLADANGGQYSVLELSGEMKPHSTDMLYGALAENVSLFYKNPVVRLGKEKKKILFGRQVIDKFSDEMERKIISDATIMDMIHRLRNPFLFLRDLLVDISYTDDIFKEEIIMLDDIMQRWDLIKEKVTDDAKVADIKYKYIGAVIPSKKMHDVNFITESRRKEVLKNLQSICSNQDELFDSLLEKLTRKGIKMPRIKKS